MSPAARDWVVSVDDHVIEPPHVWVDRLPSRYHDVGPRVVRGPYSPMGPGGDLPFMSVDRSGTCDWWWYEDLRRPLTRLDACVGLAREDIGPIPITLDEMRPGCYSPAERLADMDVNGVRSSLVFPSFPRFCGQTFLEAKDKDLALLCVRAYNDWMHDEWAASGDGRLVPLGIVPLWDVELAAAEVRRNAERGFPAVTFSELPSFLGLPSVHDADRYWDPFFAACAETGTVVCMHIGSSSNMPRTSADAPPAVTSTLVHNNITWSLVDFLFSGLFERMPGLKVAYSEGQVGWMPYILERADNVWEMNRGWHGATLSRPPSELCREHVYGCIFDDKHGMASLDVIGLENVMFEVDYPHGDSTWPDTPKVVDELFRHTSDEVREHILRSNAIELFRLTSEGLWPGAAPAGA
jgi:predicted TIM-barrel fold metal-dependent hydrolase